MDNVKEPLERETDDAAEVGRVPKGEIVFSHEDLVRRVVRLEGLIRQNSISSKLRNSARHGPKRR